ncbi:hypothetical protein KL919_000575 [Ogataea angusta]|nr:hypothetical protein KL919_000575 [Ogataea angusta]
MENNIISRKLDFEALVEKHQQLGRYFDGARYDFRSNEAVIAITEVLLKEWGLEVHVDRARLCPRLFNRLDYLEFMCQLLGSWTNHVGLDVGTGHLAIYALLGARLFDLQFVGTDIDEESLELARATVEQNNLQGKIQLVLTRPQDPLGSICASNDLGKRVREKFPHPLVLQSHWKIRLAQASDLASARPQNRQLRRARVPQQPGAGRNTPLDPILVFPARAARRRPVQQCSASENATRAPVHARQAAGADR